MSEYRVRSSGELKTETELRKLNPNMSLPKAWNSSVHDALGVDPVLEAPAPEPSAAYKSVIRNGAVQDVNGNWVKAWTEQDMFSDTTEDGVTTTKAEHEAAYQATLDAQAAAIVRIQRDDKLKDTDWRAGSDLTLSDEWATYRQALRDIPAQAGFPNSITWPTEPS